jgi:hypothetical protein
MAQIILPEDFIREQSIINNNVDMRLLTPIIVAIQDLKLRPLLGSNLYNLILTQTTPPTSLSAANKTLVDNYIIPCLHWYLVAECCVTMKFRFMNKGIMEKSGDNTQQTSTDDLKFIEHRYTSMAENYGQQLKNYIIANPSLYPTYYLNSGVDKTQPDQQPFKTGWYFPGHTSSLINGQRDEFDKINNPSWPD